MSLNGLNVMVTRPAHQAESLCQAIVKQGGLVTRFPTIEIKPTLSPSNLSTFLKRAKRADILIFISQNAVRCVAPFWQETQAKLLAVGPSTRAMIKNYSMGLTGPVPEEKISSEGLLELPELQNVQALNIVIVAGKGGNRLLENTLKQRGAKVSRCEVYKRCCPKVNVSTFLPYWEKAIDIIVSTSKEGLNNLQQMLGQAGRPFIKQVALLVISQAMEEVARSAHLGQPIIVANDAREVSIIKALNAWSNHEKFSKKNAD